MKLRDFLHEFRVSQVDLARVVGVTKGCISALARGENMPSLELAMDIEKATGRNVTVYDWGCVTTVPLVYNSDMMPPVVHKDQRLVRGLRLVKAMALALADTGTDAHDLGLFPMIDQVITIWKECQACPTGKQTRNCEGCGIESECNLVIDWLTGNYQELNELLGDSLKSDWSNLEYCWGSPLGQEIVSDVLDEMDRRYGREYEGKNEDPRTTRSRSRNEARTRARLAKIDGFLVEETPNEG